MKCGAVEIPEEYANFDRMFECPKCSGSFFGSNTSTDPWVGYCNGDYDRDGCGFEWSREDDHLYFTLVRTIRVPVKSLMK